MKRVAKTKDNPIVEIPAIVRIGVIAIEPTFTIVVTLDVEHVRVAVGIGLYTALSLPPHLERTVALPVLNFIRDL